MYLNAAWRRCSDRFDEARLFIDETAGVARNSRSSPLRSGIYGSWVLHSYSCCQFALAEIGRGSMNFLGWKYKYPSSLPNNLFKAHEKAMLDRARWLADTGNSKQASVRQILTGMYSGDWAEDSLLLAIDRNVWPDNVREWLKRLGVEDGEMAWMSDPASPATSETYKSRMKELVKERNPIAHGEPPSSLLSAELMKEWLAECRGFMERCAMTVELRLAMDHKPALRRVGVVNRSISLGKNTVPLSRLNHSLRVGDHVLLAAQGDRRKIVRIESIKSKGRDYLELPAGHEAVAIGLSKTHQNCDVFLVP
ncbi:HEPN domain-containing protein [Streptomyces microflavus]|uniref:HEPN domain-containing protein n=1 Tax=Streptomyces microflavus TaxID=1919 RepID=UPI0035D62E7F